MAKIIWLASYPKSGNTWLRALLTNYIHHGGSPADINQLDGGPIAGARVWFDEWAGVKASALSDNTIERLRPEVYRCLAGEAIDTLFMKVHDAWRRTDRDEPLFPAEVTAGVVYIIRNPLDLAMSCAHHWGCDIAQAVEKMGDSDFALSRSLGGLSDQLRQRLGSWSDHMQSWLDASGLPAHCVRYEDIHRDPEAIFGAVVRFCGLVFDAVRVRKAVAFSDFAELRRQEQANGFREHSTAAPGRFFRSGQVGSWRRELPPELARRLLAAHGGTMRRFGYGDENGS